MKKEELFEIWMNNYLLAKEYYEHYGNLDVPNGFKTNDGISYDGSGKNLHHWLNNQYMFYRRGTLSKEKKELLDKIGFVFENRGYDEMWNKMYELARCFYMSNGNLRVPYDFITSDGVNYDVNGEKLGKWISWQRHSYKNKSLSLERFKLLNNIGMIWGIGNNRTQIYELCQKYGIKLKSEQLILKRISYLEFYLKFYYLLSNNMEIARNGCLHEIFSMSDEVMKERYGVSLAELMNEFSFEVEYQEDVKKYR